MEAFCNFSVPSPIIKPLWPQFCAHDLFQFIGLLRSPPRPHRFRESERSRIASKFWNKATIGPESAFVQKDRARIQQTPHAKRISSRRNRLLLPWDVHHTRRVQLASIPRGSLYRGLVPGRYSPHRDRSYSPLHLRCISSSSPHVSPPLPPPARPSPPPLLPSPPPPARCRR